jgi:hypothetical protein
MMTDGALVDTAMSLSGTRACLQSPGPEDDRHDIQHSAEALIGLFNRVAIRRKALIEQKKFSIR